MPHINLLYPFVPPEQFDVAAGRISAVCARHPRFRLCLRWFAWFRHRPGRYTIWLRPEPVEPLRRLHADLAAQFPHCDDLDRLPHGYTPHLSIGQFSGRHEALLAFVDRLQRHWQPLGFQVDHVSLIQRGEPPDDVFREVMTFSLGLPAGA